MVTPARERVKAYRERKKQGIVLPKPQAKPRLPKENPLKKYKCCKCREPASSIINKKCYCSDCLKGVRIAQNSSL